MILGLTVVALLPSLVVAHTPPITAAQILERTQRAYDSVKTFEEDVRGQTGSNTGTAHISFSRPGKLRAEGKGMLNAKYVLIVNGSSVNVFNAGTWQSMTSPFMGIATVTGVASGTPTTVPEFLLHIPLTSIPPAASTYYKVSEATMSGKNCYKLDCGGMRRAPVTIWIDKATGFLVKTHASIMRTSIDVDYAPPKVNKPIPGNRFTK